VVDFVLDLVLFGFFFFFFFAQRLFWNWLRFEGTTML